MKLPEIPHFVPFCLRGELILPFSEILPHNFSSKKPWEFHTLMAAYDGFQVNSLGGEIHTVDLVGWDDRGLC